MTVKYCLPVPVFHFWPKVTHPATRSLCDSWATCSVRCGRKWVVIQCGVSLFSTVAYFTSIQVRPIRTGHIILVTRAHAGVSVSITVNCITSLPLSSRSWKHVLRLETIASIVKLKKPTTRRNTNWRKIRRDVIVDVRPPTWQ